MHQGAFLFRNARLISLFFCGDVMTGRGIDQVLPYPSDPIIHEAYLKDARGYIELAEQGQDPFPRKVDFSYIWGDVLEELERINPDFRIINLETSITTSNDYLKSKGINYRMNPRNVPCFTEAKIDYCSLANNHVLDWGYAGLTETLDVLDKAQLKHAGAGRNSKEAQSPAIMEYSEKGRLIVFSFGSGTSGIPNSWIASEALPGINLIPDFSVETIEFIKEKVGKVKQPNDVVVASIHWGGNWGYEVPADQREFAHRLIDHAGIDIIHGHSSHHVKGIEVYNHKLILYGCGDFLNDYEGITGYELFRGDLGLMYFASIDSQTGNLCQLRMTPTLIKYFRVNRASRVAAEWLINTLNQEGKKFGTSVALNSDNSLSLQF
ncbi:MAG: poly-gamma-glutamate biosynthesis protein [Candidatus Margulisiibacteriota bacterium]|nr:MAG: poly-gamma-glutamate biosynthesis protein [Candidatus Margulisbacteria bacterium GWD2_39_127]OGI02367.1 MAG: poly-gamma-glutamate biosynthesis protein [Candidatus Margulisbacteria bacterium GWF2_38_17]OGI08500.1 MAG: poly-gamma-glutamate biosynthesis protein [Candidatus Margulisbacteria bacterium GWE2_39_32]PZM79012.1 MAG: poly-gamma-glutamate biosynthesis protein [Candidatus Margulisiibacteriota bacterium]HAR64209.1 poly-gamma-glutamate biosynthesis protein [Candidatus Margulisiibacter